MGNNNDKNVETYKFAKNEIKELGNHLGMGNNCTICHCRGFVKNVVADNSPDNTCNCEHKYREHQKFKDTHRKR